MLRLRFESALHSNWSGQVLPPSWLKRSKGPLPPHLYPDWLVAFALPCKAHPLSIRQRKKPGF